MKRRLFLSFTGLALPSLMVNAQTKMKNNPPAKTIASDLLKLANKIQTSQLSKTDRDSLSEQLESLSAKIQRDYNTGALCSTDSDCTKKFER